MDKKYANQYQLLNNQNKFFNLYDHTDIPTNKKNEFKQYIENKQNSNQTQKVFSTNTDEYKKNTNQLKIEKKTIVCIDSKDRDTSMFPLQSNFDAYLGKDFYNVKSIRLVSTEFPNSDQVIKNTPTQLQNNIIVWENEEDVDLNFYTNVNMVTHNSNFIDLVFSTTHKLTVSTRKEIYIYNSAYNSIIGIVDGYKTVNVIDSFTLRFPYIGGLSGSGSGTGTCNVYLGYPSYTITIKPGNYSITTLAEEMTLEFNNVRRRNGDGQYHYFTVTANLDTDILSIDSVITSQLINNPIATTAGSNIMTVTKYSHGFKTGDRVTMIGVLNTAGINGSVLSGVFYVDVLDFNTFTYTVNVKANSTVNGGGNSVLVGKDAPFRILYNSANTLIQYNIGFMDEDSSEYIGSINPISTSSLNVSNINIINSHTQLRITTTTEHNLQACNILTITNIETDIYTLTNYALITTSTNHNITRDTIVTIRNSNCTPNIDGDYTAIPVNLTQFYIDNKSIISNGNSGMVLYGADKIKIYNLRTVPKIVGIPDFYVENIVSPYEFDISFRTTEIDTASIANTIIGTTQIYVNHPNHNLNILQTIMSLNTTFANIKTYLPHSFIGNRIVGVTATQGLVTNIIDINYPNHNLVTSDYIRIENSTTNPSIDGNYYIQYVDVDNFSIYFVYATFVSGTATILTGNSVTITNTSSTPKIDGTYRIFNTNFIISSTSGTVYSTIITSSSNNYEPGDTIVISQSDNLLDGTYIISSVINNTTFTIPLTTSIVSSGSAGRIINKSRFFIDLGSTIITNTGIFPAGIINQNNKVAHYRIESENNSVRTLGGIDIFQLNGLYKTIDNYIDSNNYMIRTIANYSNKNITGGGSYVTVSSLFHGSRTIQANTIDGLTTGTLARAISLEGENYVYMVNQYLDTIVNSSGILHVFAKILLSESPGTLMFNSFISTPKIFDEPISKINVLNFKIVTSKNYEYFFNDIDYSFAIEITELVDKLTNEYATISSYSGNSQYQNLNSNGMIMGNSNLTGNAGPHATGINRTGNKN